MSSVLSSQQWDLSRQDDMAKFTIDTVEQQWSDIQSWERRLHEYSHDIEDTMIKLSIPFQENPNFDLLHASTWFDSTPDFQYLRTQLHSLRHRTEQMNAATSGLAGIAGNRQMNIEQQLSLRETQRTKALTLVGLVFIPLAYTATLFSMNERYVPGAKHFWVYFVVSVPLIAAAVGAYWLLDMLYGKSEASSVAGAFGRAKNAQNGRNLVEEGKGLFRAPTT
jgi:hypothetical protein